MVLKQLESEDSNSCLGQKLFYKISHMSLSFIFNNANIFTNF